MPVKGDPFSILNKDPERGVWKLPEAKAKVTRYIKGKKPLMMGENEDNQGSSDDDIFSAEEKEDDNKTMISKFTLKSKQTIGTIDKAQLKSQVLKIASDMNAFIVPKKLGNSNDIKHAKKIDIISEIERQAPSKPQETVLQKSEADVEVVSRRRRAPIEQTQAEEIIQNENNGENVMLGKRTAPVENKKDEELQIEDNDEEEVREEENSESEDETNTFGAKIHRPVFIKNDYREDDNDLAFKEEQQQKLEKEKIKQSIINKNKQIIIEAKKERKDEDDDLSESDRDLPNDSTDDEEITYGNWKIRELKRLKRDRQERDKEYKEREATERRRLMTDEERAKDDKRLGKHKQVQKSHYKYLQKYYKLGVFNRDEEDPLFKRDYNIAVGEDNFDKSTLPGAKHMRRGDEHKRGKGKYKDLGSEDTSNFNPDFLPDDVILNKYKTASAGLKSANEFNRPSKRKV